MSAPTPYYEAEGITLYHGDMCKLLPALDLQADLIVTDPPYGETSLAWDRWPDGWPALAASAAKSMWCFGSFRMFMGHHDEFTAAWRYSHEIVWEKNRTSGFAGSDRFQRIHEFAVHWYRGPWGQVYKAPQREPYFGPAKYVRASNVQRSQHLGTMTVGDYTDDGTRMVRTVLRAPQIRGGGPTQKPVKILTQLIEYACPPGGLVLDPFAGRASTGVAAQQSGRRAVLIEGDEREAEQAARRFDQGALNFGTAL